MKKLYSYLIISAIIIIAFISMFIYFFTSLTQIAKNDVNEHLDSIADYTANSIENLLRGNFQTLESIASILESYEPENEEVLLSHINNLNSGLLYKCFGIINTEGQGYCYHGTRFEASQNDYFTTALKGETNVSEILVDYNDGTNINIYATPLYFEEKIKYVLFGTMPVEDFLNNVDFADIEGLTTYHVVNENGFAIACYDFLPGNPDQNIFERMRNINVVNHTAQELKLAMHYRNKGEFEYEEDGKKYYVQYDPINIGSWYVFSIISDDYIVGKLSKITDMERNVAIFTAFVILILLISFFLIFINQRKRLLKDSIDALYINNGEFSPAMVGKLKEEVENQKTTLKGMIQFLDSMGIDTFDYYPKERKLINSPKTMQHYGFPQVMKEIPFSIIEMDKIDYSCYDEIIDFYDRIDRGEKSAQVVIKTYPTEGVTESLEISIYNVLDDAGDPVRGIGFLRIIT